MQPVGQKFSQLYIPKGSPLPDSERFRRRLAALFSRLTQGNSYSYGQLFQEELGVRVPYLGSGYDFQRFRKEAELRDVLDAITIATPSLGHLAAAWRQEIGRIFKEENLGYVLDARCGVHFQVDEQFAQERSAMIQILGQQRYRAARELFERAYADLDSTPPDTRNAIRHIFDASENVFKLMSGTARLDPTEAAKKMKAWTSPLYEGAAANVANQAIEGMGKWVTAAYQYRHAEGAEELSAPPIDLTILMMSNGTAFLRWLVQIDELRQKDSSPE